MTEEKLAKLRDQNQPQDYSVFEQADFQAMLEVFGLRYKKKDRAKTEYLSKENFSPFKDRSTQQTEINVASTKDHSIAPTRDDSFFPEKDDTEKDDYENREFKHENLQEVRVKVDLARDKVAETIELALQNNQDLNILDNKTNALLEIAQDFAEDAEDLNKFMQRRNKILGMIQYTTISGGIALVVLPVIGWACGYSMFI